MNYDYDRLVGKNIKKLRQQQGWTQDQLVVKLQTCGCDITRSALAKMEVGQRHIYVWEIRRLKEIFDVSYDAFFA